MPFGVSQLLGDLGRGVGRREEEGAVTVSGNNHIPISFIYNLKTRLIASF